MDVAVSIQDPRHEPKSTLAQDHPVDDGSRAFETMNVTIDHLDQHVILPYRSASRRRFEAPDPFARLCDIDRFLGAHHET
jgi:hypothetical protein